MGRVQLTHYKKNLAIRDGKECFYCGEKLDKDKLTIEHILEISDGGSDHVSNLCLACKHCNQKVIGMPVVYKIKYREMMRKIELNV